MCVVGGGQIGWVTQAGHHVAAGAAEARAQSCVRGCAKAQNSGRVAVEHAAVGARLQMEHVHKETGRVLLARCAAGLPRLT